MAKITYDLIKLYRDTFVSRSDDYSIQQDDGTYRRADFPIGPLEIASHLQGEVSLATYLIDDCGLCKFAVIDGDTDDSLERLRNMQEAIREIGIISHLEQSRRGGHLWIFTEPCKPSDLRAWVGALVPKGMELYPKQDHSDGVGSAIRLPFGIHRKSGKRYPFIGSDLRPISDSIIRQVEMIASSPRNTVPCFSFSDIQNQKAECNPNEHQKKSSSSNLSPKRILHREDILTIQQWASSQNPRAVISRYVNLSRSGLGRCPFTQHHVHGDQKPSFQFFEPRTPGGLCWRCYSSEQCGSLFDFLRLYYGMSASEMLVAIRGGATW